MATSDTSVTELVINKISQSDLDTLVSGGNVPANQMFFTPENGTFPPYLEYVGEFSANGVVTAPIDLTNYNYIAIFYLSSSADGDINLFGGANLSWTCFTKDGSSLSRNYDYVSWNKKYSGLVNILYYSSGNTTICMNVNADGVYAFTTGKPTTIYVSSSQGTISETKLVLFRYKR